MVNKVDICGVDTSKLPVLSNEEKMELLKEIKKGNEEARQKFINSNLKLVLSVLRHFYNRGNPDDLFQVGCIGLIKAIDNFDINQNVQFSTYAFPMIIGEIRRYLRDNNPIRISRSVKDLAYKSMKVRDKYLKNNQVEPTIKQIADELNVTEEEVSASLDAIQKPISLQDTVSNSDSDNFYVMDQISDKKNIDENWVSAITIGECIQKLSNKEKQIVKKRYFDCKTQMEVAEEIGISQAQVSRLEKNAIAHLKKNYI